MSCGFCIVFVANFNYFQRKDKRLAHGLYNEMNILYIYIVVAIVMFKKETFGDLIFILIRWVKHHHIQTPAIE